MLRAFAPETVVHLSGRAREAEGAEVLRIGLSQENVLELPGWSARLLLLGLSDPEDGPVQARVVSEAFEKDAPYRFEGSAPVGGVMELLPQRLFVVRSITEQMVFLDEISRR